jgi:hypothetical protein
LSYGSERLAQDALLVIGILGSGMVAVVIYRQETVLDAIVSLVVGCVVWACASLPLGSRVDLFGDRLELVNPWGTRIIPNCQIEWVAGKQFLTVRTRDGADWTAWAVQGSNLSIALGSQTRVGRVAAEISQALSTLPPAESGGPGVRLRHARPHWSFIVGELALVALTVVACLRLA